ncbi:MAG: hypothetical protein PHW52_03320 [Candidatus Pacebacteria bacterium]|nr:hypothetical protein [Candidatus Paceibacterota bacterium]
MNLEDIKKILEDEGGKLIIANENGPSLVVMSYDDYKKMKGMNSQESKKIVETRIDQLPIKERPVSQEIKSNSFGIDDLPF